MGLNEHCAPIVNRAVKTAVWYRLVPTLPYTLTVQGRPKPSAIELNNPGLEPNLPCT